MSQISLDRDLSLALRVADAADAVSLAGFNSRSFSVMHKADKSEVTEIDRATETAITNILRSERPEHSVYGEEHGIVGPADAKFQWVIDPIDGTSNFVRGVPVWASLIALVCDDVPVLGVVSAPAMNMRWWAHIESDAFLNGAKISVSNIDELRRASLSITVNKPWRDLDVDRSLEKLQRDVSRVRGYGDFWQHMLVAQGAADIAIDSIGLAPYDIAALVPIVQQAGGRCTDRLGTANWRANTLISSNSLLHDATLTYLPQ
ncbi:MAG: histidinol phosphatase [Actinobacteria bacterium]|nr:histidinol phosphatase [Actinomycetota bacterium]MDA3016520.1 histidinol phosphatase [Actinomycetota bacterium]